MSRARRSPDRVRRSERALDRGLGRGLDRGLGGGSVDASDPEPGSERTETTLAQLTARSGEPSRTHPLDDGRGR